MKPVDWITGWVKLTDWETTGWVKSADWVAIIYTGPGGFSLGWLESLRFWFMAKKQRMMV